MKNKKAGKKKQIMVVVNNYNQCTINNNYAGSTKKDSNQFDLPTIAKKIKEVWNWILKAKKILFLVIGFLIPFQGK